MDSNQGAGLVFSSVDEIRRTYEPVMHAMAAAGGPLYEVVLHDLSAEHVDLGSTIAAIENGDVTGRSVGGPSSSLGAGVIHDMSADHDAFGYRGHTADGRELRCSSVYFRNPEGRVIAALCVNVDISAARQAQEILAKLAPAVDAASVRPGTDEIIAPDLASVLDLMIIEAVNGAGKSVDAMSREDRVDVVLRLDRKGALKIRKAADRIAARLCVSRATVYAYLEEGRARASVDAGSV